MDNLPQWRLHGNHPLVAGEGDVYCDYPGCQHKKERSLKAGKAGTVKKAYQSLTKTKATAKLTCSTCNNMGFHFDCWNMWHAVV